MTAFAARAAPVAPESEAELLQRARALAGLTLAELATRYSLLATFQSR